MGILDQQLSSDFFMSLRGRHILLLASADVDAVCCCKILQTLFKADDVQYTLVPVVTKEDLLKAYSEHSDQIKTIVLLNCGGSINIVEYFEPEEDMQFYIIDSHRPIELDNVYNQGQVQVIVHEKEEFDFPLFNDIYGSDVESEDDEQFYSDEESEPNTKKRRTENSYQERKKKHIWKKRREDILFKYNEFTHFGTAISYIMFELAHKMSRGTNEIVWWAIIGLTEQLLFEKIDRESYVTHVHQLQPHVLRLNRIEDELSSVNNMKIFFENELRLQIYRHWTLYDSFCHSDYVSCRFKTWTSKGHKKLLEFLAGIGLPLVQAKQKFSAMDIEMRDNVKSWVMKSAAQYGLDDITYGSFVAQIGYKHILSASDMVLCIAALMEDNFNNNGFLVALDTLTHGNLDNVLEGLELAKQQQIAIVKEVRNLTDMHRVVCAGPFIYACVDKGSPHSKWFYNSITLGRLARYLRETWTTVNKKARDYPFIVCSPADPTTGMCLAMGIPPLADDTHKSEFHNAFQMAAQRVQAKVAFNHFNSTIVEISVEVRGKFFDALSALSL